jgi:hypothetical protein
MLHESDLSYGLQIEHITSEKHGGSTTLENLAAACMPCNLYKGTDIATLNPMTKELVRLFNPRLDLWSEHFRLDQTRLQGITTVGQATVSLLGFNITERLKERETLIWLGRFPSPRAIQRMKGG